LLELLPRASEFDADELSIALHLQNMELAGVGARDTLPNALRCS
jgi:hypothetical protein